MAQNRQDLRRVVRHGAVYGGRIDVGGWVSVALVQIIVRNPLSSPTPRSHTPTLRSGPQRRVGMVRAHFGSVTFLERRQGVGKASIDRRKSFVDVVERVLGNSPPPVAPIGSRRFVTHLNTSLLAGSTISEIFVSVLDRPSRRRGH